MPSHPPPDIYSGLGADSRQCVQHLAGVVLRRHLAIDLNSGLGILAVLEGLYGAALGRVGILFVNQQIDFHLSPLLSWLYRMKHVFANLFSKKISPLEESSGDEVCYFASL